jgi:hypothetical protein
MYAALLTFVATARDKGGDSNWSGTKVTHLYEEVIQASLGSRWIWALAFASTVEGLVKQIVPKGTKRAGSDDDAIASLSKHIAEWPGKNAHMKSVAIGAVARTAETSANQALRDLQKALIVSKDQVKAWEKMRNKVMHGSLISRYSTEEEDKLLLDLAGLMHALTKHVVKIDQPCPAAPKLTLTFNIR